MVGTIATIVGIEIATNFGAQVNDTVVSDCVSKYTKWTESEGAKNER